MLARVDRLVQGLQVASPAVVVIGAVVSVAPELADAARLLDHLPEWAGALAPEAARSPTDTADRASP